MQPGIEVGCKINSEAACQLVDEISGITVDEYPVFEEIPEEIIELLFPDFAFDIVEKIRAFDSHNFIEVILVIRVGEDFRQ